MQPIELYPEAPADARVSDRIATLHARWFASSDPQDRRKVIQSLAYLHPSRAAEWTRHLLITGNHQTARAVVESLNIHASGPGPVAHLCLDADQVTTLLAVLDIDRPAPNPTARRELLQDVLFAADMIPGHPEGL